MRNEDRGLVTVQSSEQPKSVQEEKTEPLFTIPLNKKNKEFHIFDEDIRQWKDTFPGVDVLGELRRARQWSIDNPKRRKTAAGIRNHLSSWMGKSQNLAKGLGSTSAVPNCKNCQYNNPGPCTNLKKPGFDPEKCSAYVGGC